jgi:biopolymer transport protein TolR
VKMSRRAKRMERHHKRSRTGVVLNMVSLMDIFTILVFFLLVHSSDVENLPSVKSVKLPESVAEKLPKQTVIVMVNGQDILVQGRKVASVESVYATAGMVIEPLKTELDHHAGRALARARFDQTQPRPRREITIMGDKDIPYRLLKRIMVTCVSAKYDNISLAVLRKTPQKG